MRHLLFLSALFLWASPAWSAEPIVLPKPGTKDLVGVIHVDEPSGWAALMISGGQFMPVQVTQWEGDEATGYKTCIVNGPAGSYAVIQNTGKQTKIHALLLGGLVPIPPTPIPPTPVPPDPVPPNPPEPTPPPNPTPAGTRILLIFRESASDTPAQGRLFTSLQAGQASQYLKSKGHACFVLDVDAKDADGNVSPTIKQWQPHYAGMTAPVLIIVDKTNGKIVHKVSLPDSATGEDVLTILKAHGG